MSAALKRALAGLSSVAATRLLGRPGLAVSAAAAALVYDDPVGLTACGVGAAAGLAWHELSGLEPAAGVAMTVWTSDDLQTAWNRQRAAFEEVQPQIAILHVGLGGGANAQSVAAQVREAVPGVRLWTQVSTDPAMTAGAQSALDTGHRVVTATGSEAVCWNAERAFKAAGGAEVARDIVDGWKPTGVPQLQSAYSSPAGHSSYPWAAWLVDGCVASLCQDYPFGDDVRTGTRPDGTLQSRIAAGKAGWQQAVAAGLISKNVVRGTYIPGAHLETQDVVRATAGIPYVAVWPWHGVYDAQMIAALRVVRDRF